MSYQLVETVVAYNVNTFIYCLLTFKIQRRWIFFEDPCILRPRGVKGGKKKREMKMELGRTHTTVHLLSSFTQLYSGEALLQAGCVLCSAWYCCASTRNTAPGYSPAMYNLFWSIYLPFSEHKTESVFQVSDFPSRELVPFPWVVKWVQGLWHRHKRVEEAEQFCFVRHTQLQDSAPLFPTVIAKFGDLSPTRVR